MAKGSASVTQKVAIINITYAHLKACKKIKERAFRLNTGLLELGAEGSHTPSSSSTYIKHGADYAHHIPLGFSDLPTVLKHQVL